MLADRCVSAMKSVLLAACVLAVAAGQSQQDGRIEVRWGIADTAATVGRLFRMHVPGDAFSGPVKAYTVKTADGSPLPAWLQFDTADSILEGIPVPKDAGQIDLELTASGADPKNQASVTFSLLVREVAAHTAGAPLRFKASSGPEFVRCRRSEPETVATLVLDTDLEGMSVSERIAMLRRFLQHMGLHEDMVKLEPVAGRPWQDGSALVSGVGDTSHAQPQSPGTFVSWPVGCGQVKEGHFPALQLLDDDSRNGRMGQALLCPIIGWHVTNSHLQAPKRKRRAAVYHTATPVATPVMPTKTMTEEETMEKMTHTIVERVSPTFVQPSPTRPPMEKTDEPAMTEKVQPPAMSSKQMVTEATPPLPPMKKTDGMIEPTKTTEDPTKPTDMPKPPVDDSCVKNQAPKVNRRIDQLTYVAGEVIDFVIPEDTFQDCEVGDTRNLALSLYKDTMMEIPRDSFFKFDKKNQRLYGLPDNDNAGSYDLKLIAQKGDKVNNVKINMLIKPLEGDALKSVNHALSMTVDYNYDEFMENVTARMELSNNIANVFGDPDSSNMLVTGLSAGSVVYTWTNKSLSSGGCPTGDIADNLGKAVNQDGTLTAAAIEKLKPFTLLSVASEPMGDCEGNPAFPKVTSKPRADLKKTDDGTVTIPKDKDDGTTPKETDNKDKDDEKIAKGTAGGDDDDGDDKTLTMVVVAVVIVVVLVVGLLVACILYRRKRKGKMDVEEKNTFINKHPPVIFPDELEEKPSSEVNKPLLMSETNANTSAAGPPPDYHRPASESPERLTNNGGAPATNGHPDDTDDITELPERPYDPPPPVTSSGGSGKTPRPAQQPFSQPPQILP